MPNGSLVLTGEADHSVVFINDPGQADQNASFYTLPAGDTPDDAIVPTATSGTFIIGNQGANDVVSVRVTGLEVTALLSGLNAPHGLAFVPDAVAAESPVAGSDSTSGGAGATARINGTHIVATAPMGDSLPHSITIGAGSLWVEYGNGAPGNGGGTSQIVRYSATGQVQHTYTAAGLADGLKYDPSTGNAWVLNNSCGDMGTNMVTGQLAPLPVSDPDSPSCCPMARCCSPARRTIRRPSSTTRAPRRRAPPSSACPPATRPTTRS